MRAAILLQRLAVVLLVLHTSALPETSDADFVSQALKLHAQSTVLPTHLLDDKQLFSGRHLLQSDAASRTLQAVQSGGRYVQIRNPTMSGEQAGSCGGLGVGCLAQGASVIERWCSSRQKAGRAHNTSNSCNSGRGISEVRCDVARKCHSHAAGGVTVSQ